MKSSLPFTSVVSYHTNPMTCGVAKFSAMLAERLGVPFGGFKDGGHWGQFPLLSLKWSEFREASEAAWLDVALVTLKSRIGVFWHDAGDNELSERASVVYYADPSLGSPGLWCPSLLQPSKPRTVKLFSFGMAHKLQTQYYAKVKQLLDDASLRYHLRVSVGIHEGTSLSDATKHFDALYEILGRENVTVLGILSDDAVVEELERADYVLAFFEQGLRANNTTVHAAVQRGCRVVSNYDEGTPSLLRAMTTNVEEDWIAQRFAYSWEHLIDSMERIYAKSLDTQSTHR